MRKILKVAAIVLFVSFLAIQFVRPDQTNPVVNAAETLEATTETPENVKGILERSCNDCHTNATVYPWYSKISPFNWFLANHINEGRRELNFSVWSSYENSRKRRKLDAVCEQVSDGEMPLPSYLWIHRSAHLSPEDIKILCDWSDAEREKLAQKQ